MSQIDIRDISIGSYVAGGMGELLEVTLIDGPNNHISLKRPHYSGDCMFTDCINLHSIPISPEWLERVGWERNDRYDGKTSWKWGCIEFDEDGDLYVDSIYTVEMCEVEEGVKDWVLSLSESENYIARLWGVHHLQALVWQCDRSWLTIKPEPTP